VSGAIVAWAADNPGALTMPFVAGLVREDLGPKLTDPTSTDPTQVTFVVQTGDTATTIAERLVAEGLLSDPRAFVLTALDRGVEGKLEAGTFVLRRNMTPDQLVGSLLEAKDPAVTVTIREGLRLEGDLASLLRTTEDRVEGARAFLEKRKPRWTGR
jgi:cell division protein YceG involved in septum cleavage